MLKDLSTILYLSVSFLHALQGNHPGKCLHLWWKELSNEAERLNQRRASKLPGLEPIQRTQIPDLKFNSNFLRSNFHFLSASSLLFTERVEALRGSERALSHTKSLSQGHGEEVSVNESGIYSFFFPLNCIREHKLREKLIKEKQVCRVSAHFEALKALLESCCNAFC